MLNATFRSECCMEEQECRMKSCRVRAPTNAQENCPQRSVMKPEEYVSCTGTRISIALEKTAVPGAMQ